MMPLRLLLFNGKDFYHAANNLRAWSVMGLDNSLGYFQNDIVIDRLEVCRLLISGNLESADYRSTAVEFSLCELDGICHDKITTM